ncbi:MAG: hypothetical protein AAB573_02465 [Patescibacteria group bacterium]
MGLYPDGTDFVRPERELKSPNDLFTDGELIANIEADAGEAIKIYGDAKNELNLLTGPNGTLRKNGELVPQATEVVVQSHLKKIEKLLPRLKALKKHIEGIISEAGKRGTRLEKHVTVSLEQVEGYIEAIESAVKEIRDLYAKKK